MKREFLNLGIQPLANNFLSLDFIGEEEKYPLIVGFDEDTYLVSLLENAPPSQMFNDRYIYHSSHSPSLVRHFREIAIRLQSTLPRFGHILEIGTNDGPFLRNFGVGQGVGVEPCENFASLLRERGYTIYDEFWSSDLARKIKNKHGKVNIIYAANTFCHIQNLDDAFNAISLLLRDDGIFVMEDPSLLEVIKNNEIDQFYAEHNSIFSIIALNKLLQSYNLEICDVEYLDIHGGSNRVYISRCGKKKISTNVLLHITNELNYGLHRLDVYEEFSQRVKKNMQDFRSLIDSLHKLKYNNIAIFGATSKVNLVCCYCNIGPELISCMFDSMESKIGKFSPGMHIPIQEPSTTNLKEFDHIVIGVWNMMDEVINKMRNDFNYKNSFITYIPRVRIL